MVFTDNGTNELINWLASNSSTAPAKINIGNDSTQPQKSDSTLSGELTRLSFDTTSVSDKQVEFSATLLSTEQNGLDLKEFGLNSAAVSGTQFTRSVHATIEKTSTIEVQYTIRLRLTN